jgi:hypothetical protein
MLWQEANERGIFQRVALLREEPFPSPRGSIPMKKSEFRSTTFRAVAMAAGFGLATVVGGIVPAAAYSAKIKNACKADYHRFCPGYGEDSPQLKACMRSAGGNISVRCRDALADGGYIPRKYHSSNVKK